MPPTLTREQAESLTRRVLAFSTAEEARVNVGGGWRGNTRFAAGEITTAGDNRDLVVTITSSFGRKSASAQTNLLDDASLKRTVELSERLARLSPEDPEQLPVLGPQQYGAVSAYLDRTADLTPEARAIAVQRALAGARAGGAGAQGVDVDALFVAGYMQASGGASAVATSKGLFAYHAATEVSMSCTVRTPDGTGSGYASAGAADWGLLDAAALGRRAAEKAVRSRNAQAVEPGAYTVVLEPQAVADLIPQLGGSFQARSADEGRSAFSKQGGGNRIGEKIMDSRVTLLSDPADPDLLTSPFTGEGLPTRRTVWVENGVLKNLSYSRYWAQRQNVQPTGAGLGGGGGGGGGSGFKMMGGTKSVDELIAGTQRGILVTRFWYIRFLDQRTAMVTGLTRDGTFLIEGGKVTRPVKNLRFNESPLFMLNKIEELGRTERVEAGLVVPSMRVKDFTFTSLSDAV